jgi:hypothetical protein
VGVSENIIDASLQALVESIEYFLSTEPEPHSGQSPLLDPPAADYDGPEDAAINHDHYLYGGPKQYEKVDGKWVLQPPIA